MEFIHSSLFFFPIREETLLTLTRRGKYIIFDYKVKVQETNERTYLAKFGQILKSI